MNGNYEGQSGLIQPKDRKYKERGIKRQEHIEFKNDNCSHALRTSVIPVTAISLKSKDKRLKSLIEKTDFKEGKVLNMDLYNQTINKNISQCITEPHHNSQRLFDGLQIRKLTPKECWRLMGFDDEDFDKASEINSDTQLYKQAGNSIVVNVLVEILKKLL
jgi:DNA (cytosine-5)-methyltransferase 1